MRERRFEKRTITLTPEELKEYYDFMASKSKIQNEENPHSVRTTTNNNPAPIRAAANSNSDPVRTTSRLSYEDTPDATNAD